MQQFHKPLNVLQSRYLSDKGFACLEFFNKAYIFDPKLYTFAEAFLFSYLLWLCHFLYRNYMFSFIYGRFITVQYMSFPNTITL